MQSRPSHIEVCQLWPLQINIFDEMIKERRFFYWTVALKLMSSFDINEIITRLTNKWDEIEIIGGGRAINRKIMSRNRWFDVIGDRSTIESNQIVLVCAFELCFIFSVRWLVPCAYVAECWSPRGSHSIQTNQAAESKNQNTEKFNVCSFPCCCGSRFFFFFFSRMCLVSASCSWFLFSTIVTSHPSISFIFLGLLVFMFSVVVFFPVECQSTVWQSMCSRGIDWSLRQQLTPLWKIMWCWRFRLNRCFGPTVEIDPNRF